MTPRIIIIEGPDNCGKSTLAKQIADRYNANYWHMTSGPGLEQKEAMSLYQRDALKNALVNLDSGRSTVFDRHWISDQVYGLELRNGPALPFEEMLQWSLKNDVLFIFCYREDAVQAHAQEKDPDHPYDDGVYAKLVEGYDAIRHVLGDYLPENNIIGYCLDNFLEKPDQTKSFIEGLSKL